VSPFLPSRLSRVQIPSPALYVKGENPDNHADSHPLSPATPHPEHSITQTIGITIGITPQFREEYTCVR
jgi:hypothetical protein